MPKYQLGTARVAGRETVVLFAENAYLDVSTLWNTAPVRQALLLTGDEQPRSLMLMLDHWSYWHERLPLLVEFLFAQEGRESLPGLINPTELEWLPPLRYPRKLICIGVNYHEHLASIMTLEPGDVIATGTPAGVGFGKKPPEVLHPGDIMSVEIEEPGRLEIPVVS